MLICFNFAYSKTNASNVDFFSLFVSRKLLETMHSNTLGTYSPNTYSKTSQEIENC